jgi:hypothetical protein
MNIIKTIEYGDEFEKLKELENYEATKKELISKKRELELSGDCKDYYIKLVDEVRLYYEWIIKMEESLSIINDNKREIKRIDSCLYFIDREITQLRKSIQEIQKKYLFKHFDTTRITKGTIIEFDYTGGLSSSRVKYYITKSTKTYLEGYSIIGDTCGDVRKITKKQVVFIY